MMVIDRTHYHNSDKLCIFALLLQDWSSMPKTNKCRYEECWVDKCKVRVFQMTRNIMECNLIILYTLKSARPIMPSDAGLNWSDARLSWSDQIRGEHEIPRSVPAPATGAALAGGSRPHTSTKKPGSWMVLQVPEFPAITCSSHKPIQMTLFLQCLAIHILQCIASAYSVL